MPAPIVITVTPRKLYLEDLAVTTNPAGETASVGVLQTDGTSTAETLNKIAAVLYTAFGRYANDGAAATGGVAVGQIYYSSTLAALKARMT